MLKVLDTTTETEETPATPTLDDLAREGARRLLMAALQVEVAQYVDAYQEARDARGRRLVVRHGQAEARKVTCGAGTVEVRAPRVNDKRVDATGQRERFTSRILPPSMRRSPKVAEVLPILSLRGLSTGDFREALPVLLGDDAAGLSATNIARLTAVWEDEYRQFRQRDLADRDYVYVWVDGLHCNIRLEDDRLSVSNSLSGRHWELDQVPAVGDPTDIVQFGTGHRVAAGEGQRRVALQRRVAAYLVVVGLEVGKFPFKITGIPEQHLVETFSPRRSDQALHEGVGPGHMRHGLDCVDLQNPQVRRPPVRLEQRIMIGAEMARGAPTMHGGVEHAAEVGASDRTAVHADADEAARALVHDHEHPVAPEHDGLASKEVHTPQAVCRVADERQPRGPGSARDGAIVCRQHAAHDVLIDVGPERSRDDARNPWTAEPRIT